MGLKSEVGQRVTGKIESGCTGVAWPTATPRGVREAAERRCAKKLRAGLHQKLGRRKRSTGALTTAPAEADETGSNPKWCHDSAREGKAQRGA